MSNQSDAVAGTPASLVEVWRGPIVESRHRGHLTAVDGKGATIAELGLPETVTYVRSSGKPFQAIPVIVSGAADRFGFTEQEIAIACGSHSGEAIHVDTVRSMLNKSGLDESALKCGVHEPFSAEVTRELTRNQKPPNVLQNNCSGKHAAMLALARHVGASTEDYDDWRNPAQQAIAVDLKTAADQQRILDQGTSRLAMLQNQLAAWQTNLTRHQGWENSHADKASVIADDTARIATIQTLLDTQDASNAKNQITITAVLADAWNIQLPAWIAVSPNLGVIDSAALPMAMQGLTRPEGI